MAKRNLTLQLDDETIRRAKVIAASRDTSVSALVAAQIESIVAAESSYDAAHRRYRELVRRVVGSSGGERTDRDSLHDRAALRAEPA